MGSFHIYSENHSIENIYILEEDDENKTMIVSCDIEINFNIGTEAYMDYENGIYDKEDNQWITFSKIKTEFEYKKSLEIEFTIEIEDIVEKEFNIMYEGQSIDIQFDSFELENGSHTVQEHIIEYQ